MEKLRYTRVSECVGCYDPTLFVVLGKLQSAEDEITEDGLDRHEVNVEFLDKTKQDILTFDKVQDNSFKMDVQPKLDLTTFLSRPVQAFNFDWVSGGHTPLVIYPWELFLDNLAVKNKLANFSFLSCRLHVEIKVNSTPFNYGSMLFAYHPLPKFSPNTLQATTKLDRVCKSQRPHIWISPEHNSGGTMVLPFFFYKNFLKLSSRQEIRDMGEIDIIEYVQLRNASNVANSPVNVQVFIHAIDVVLTGGTTSGILQSSKDEYSVQPISRPASAIASAASHLTSVPVIGPFAKATEIGASAISSVAKIFGYTNPPVIENSSAYKSIPFNGIASAEISEPKDKFTLDPKAELTIDPRTTGIDGQDELAVPYIVQKESFLTTFNWTIADVTDTLLFNTLITPSLREIEEVTSGAIICYTPMSHLANLFNNWRGDIIIKFKFVCSQYHKGRVRISWDPNGDLIANSDTMNTVFTKIVDLEVDRTVELRIPYMQPKPWLETASVRDPSRTKDWQTENFTDLSGFVPFYGNGTLTVRVLTNLSAPSPNADIEVMTFIRGASNLEFANPIDISDRLSQFSFQSGIDEVVRVDVGETNKVDEQRYLINYGESITSIRTLLRRSTLTDIVPLEQISAGNNSAYVIINLLMNKFPIPPGFNPNVNTRASTSIFTSEPYAFTHMTPFNWMQSCYIGCRGALQWRFNVNANGASPIESVRLVRSLEQMNNTPLTSADSGNGLNENEYYSFFQTHTTSGCSGISLTNQRTQAALSTELNQFNQNRFVSCSNFNTTLGLAEDNSDRETYILQMFFANQGRNDIAGTLIERYANIGTDFNFFFYLNAPITFYLNENVTPN